MLDILIENTLAVTLDKQRRILPNCSIGIKNGIIVEIGEKVTSSTKKTIDGKSCYALPGFINCHTHVYQALIEGVGYDMHFLPWNIRYLAPLVSNIGPEHARASAELAALEMIKSGTTTFSDHWYLHTDFRNIEEVAEAFDKSGLRSHLVFGFLSESFAGKKSRGTEMKMVQKEDYLLEKAEAFAKKWHKKNRTTTALGPGSTEDVSGSMFKKIIKIGREMDLSVVTHVSGWIEIVSKSLQKYGLRDLEYAYSLGFGDAKDIIIHGTWLSPYEIKLVAETGTKVVHNPVANMHLGYGAAPVSEMIANGVTVGLGTDGAASYTYDMFEVGKTAAMLAKVVKLDAEALTAEKALEMLTIDGAKVLGLEDITGSLEVGKKADIILINYRRPHIMPGGKPVPKIVYSAKGSDVVTSLVDGRVIMENRKVLLLDEKKVMENADRQRENLYKKAGKDVDLLLNAKWSNKRASWRMV